MVLQPPLAARRAGGRVSAIAGVSLLALAGGCGKGQSTPATTPPSSGANEGVEGIEGGEAVEPTDRGRARPESVPATAEDEEELYVDGVRLRLQPAGCVLTVAFLGQEHRHRFASFPGACHFAPDPHGQPWVVPTEHGKAVLVESSVPAEGGCDTALQVVVVTERGPQLSREIQRVSGCGPGPWDEMMYHVLASDRVPLGAS